MACKVCGLPECKKHSALFSSPRQITNFSGSSPPEIFVGHWRYPDVYAGILSPQEYGNTELLSSPERWHSNKLPIDSILSLRQQLTYARGTTNVKQPSQQFIKVMQEVAMTHKSIATEFKLKKPITQNKDHDSHVPLITNAAPIASVRLQENPKIDSKVEYLVNDNHAKSSVALIELEKHNTKTETLIKLLSAGLLGQKEKRRLVPTRWAITAVDDTLSKNKLKSIRFFPEISDYRVFNAEYLGNHYEFLLIPDKFSFEVIEHGMTSSGFWHDYEFFQGRKYYASSVTGAYYVNRLALTEYLEKIKRQALCLVFREIRPEYNVPLGVGILRQISREAFSKHPETFSSKEEALASIQSRLQTPVSTFIQHSVLLKEMGKQTKLSKFFN